MLNQIDAATVRINLNDAQQANAGLEQKVRALKEENEALRVQISKLREQRQQEQMVRLRESGQRSSGPRMSLTKSEDDHPDRQPEAEDGVDESPRPNSRDREAGD